MPDQAFDVYAALRYLSHLDFVGPARVAVFGQSMGGETALHIVDRDLGAQFFAERFRAVIAYYPYCDIPAATMTAPTLILIGEADRLKMTGLEQMRAIFDQGGIGKILIGMPGLEKRLARYPRLYARIGFVHECKPLSREEVRQLLQDRWWPAHAPLTEGGIADEESVAAIIRITGGNFRLLHRLLTRIGRILEINKLEQVTPPVVDAARESLVIGTS